MDISWIYLISGSAFQVVSSKNTSWKRLLFLLAFLTNPEVFTAQKIPCRHDLRKSITEGRTAWAHRSFLGPVCGTQKPAFDCRMQCLKGSLHYLNQQ